MKECGDKIDTTWLVKLLEKEKDAGIPSIPEALKPEQIETIWNGGRRRKKRYYKYVGGYAAVAAAFAFFLIVCPPKKANFMEEEKLMTGTQTVDSGMFDMSDQTTNTSSGAEYTMQAESIPIKGTKEDKAETTEEAGESETMMEWDEEYRKQAFRPQGFPKEYKKR